MQEAENRSTMLRSVSGHGAAAGGRGMSARQKPAQTAQAPSKLPSVLDIGREIVRLSNKCHELDCARIQLKQQGLPHFEECQQDISLKRRMDRSFEREYALVDVALGMRAYSLGDVAVMLDLAWRVTDGQASSEFEEEDRDRALAQIKHAILTSLDVVIKESGPSLNEALSNDIQTFIDLEHTDMGDGL